MEAIDPHTIYLGVAYGLAALLLMIEVVSLRVQGGKLRRGRSA